MSAPRLEIEALTVRFGGLAAVDDVSFSVAPGPVHGLIGPNGAGKTTLFNLISGLVAPSGGAIRLDGQRIDDLPSWGRARPSGATSRLDRCPNGTTSEAPWKMLNR